MMASCRYEHLTDQSYHPMITWYYIPALTGPSLKGQFGVPLTYVYPLYLLCFLGILGDEITHKYPRAKKGLYYGISHDGVRWAQGTSLPIP